MICLPIDAEIPRILEQLRRSGSAVVVAEPGAGKTTRLPPAIVGASMLSHEYPNLIMLQPRRIAARMAARRIADEQNWTLGQEVGYQVRFERCISANTRLRIVTEGILAQQLLANPELPGVGAVILDEFHERSLHADLALAMLRELRQALRPDLMLIVMSATLDASPVSEFLDAPIIEIPGRTYPVRIEHRPAAGGTTETKSADAVRDALDSGARNILVFLPGAEEIRRTQQLLGSLSNVSVLPLHGSLPAEQQDQALAPSDLPKVVLATNIAETSLTIPGIDAVIDAGLHRLPIYDSGRGIDRLELLPISRASADQRAGRAGRTGPGRCIRLWTARHHQSLEPFDLPEIQRLDLSSALLAVYAWGAADQTKFQWYQAPPELAVKSAQSLLQLLGAIERAPGSEHNFRITQMGRQMMELPLPVRLARLMIDATKQGLLRPAATIAAIISEKDFVRRSINSPDAMHRGARAIGDSDLLQRIHLLEQFSAGNALPDDDPVDRFALRNVLRVRDQLCRLMRDKSPAASNDGDEQQLKLALLAYPDRVVRRRENDPATGLMVGGTGVRLAAESVVWRGEFYLALDLQIDHRSVKSQALVRLASRIEPDWLIEHFPHAIEHRRELVFDLNRRKVIVRNQTWYRDLLIDQREGGAPEPVAAGQLLGDWLAEHSREFFDADAPAKQFMARVALLRRVMPEHPWPAFDEQQLAEILRSASTGKSAVSQLPSPISLLQSALAYPLDRLLETHAPLTITVPSGRHVAIDYLAPTAPVLAVRLQELFGLSQTPAIAAGRVPLLLHLLAPNYRPVQITTDLASFWSTTYFQVRKDLKARYPKHPWPDDPRAATAPRRKLHP